MEQHKAPAGCSPTPQLLQHLFAELQEPFTAYMLQHLPGPQLAALRATCTLLRQFVNRAPASSIKHISQALLPKHSSQNAANSAACSVSSDQCSMLCGHASSGESGE